MVFDRKHWRWILINDRSQPLIASQLWAVTRSQIDNKNIHEWFALAITCQSALFIRFVFKWGLKPLIAFHDVPCNQARLQSRLVKSWVTPSRDSQLNFKASVKTNTKDFNFTFPQFRLWLFGWNKFFRGSKGFHTNCARQKNFRGRKIKPRRVRWRGKLFSPNSVLKTFPRKINSHRARNSVRSKIERQGMRSHVCWCDRSLFQPPGECEVNAPSSLRQLSDDLHLSRMWVRAT